MKPIKITDTAAIDAALLAVNGKATVHTYTHAHQLAKIHSEGDAGRHALSDDGGKRARAALAKHSPEAP